MKKALILTLLLFLFLSSNSMAILRIEKEAAPQENDLVAFGSNVEVKPLMTVPSAVAIGGNVYVSGNVEEDVVAIGGSVYLDKTAIVKEDVVAIGGKVEKQSGAIVNGEVIEINLPGFAPFVSGITKNKGTLPVLGLVWGFISFLAFLGLCIIIVALFTKSIGNISSTIEKKPWHMIMWGLLSFVIMPLLIILLIFSLIGIIFIPIVIFIFIAAGLAGHIAASQLLGKLILKAARIKNKPMMQEMILGLVILSLAGMVPFIGWLFKFIALTIGLGAVSASRFGNQTIK